MRTLFFLLGLPFLWSTPLQQTSLLTLRTLLPPKAGGGTAPPPLTYGPLILEEWDTANNLQQTWTPPCSLPGLSTESWTEGRITPRFPWGDQAWFLCRNVPVNSSLSYNPASVSLMYLDELGTLGSWAEEAFYPNGTNALNILPYYDEQQSIHIFYMLGGGATGKPAQARIRVDTGQGTPPDVQGGLLSSTTGITINQLRILNKTLYGMGAYGSAANSVPAAFQIGSQASLPTAGRSPAITIPIGLQVLSSWTDPFGTSWWHTGLNRTGYLGHTENGMLQLFPLPPSASTGTLGGASWTVATARQESTEFVVYLTNTSHIVKNTLNGLQNGLPYQPVMQAPPGWRYLSAHARNPNLPTPIATATASASASASATGSATATTSASSSPSPSASATPSSSTTSTPTAAPTISSTPSSSASASAYPSGASLPPSPSPTASPSASNGTIPLPPDSNQATNSGLSTGEQTGIGLGSIAAFCIAGLAFIKFSPSLKNLWTSQFGSSIPKHTGVNFRKPISTDLPITISHNPNVLVQQRLEQLKDLQKQISMREVDIKQTSDIDRTKKQFGPVVPGDIV